MTGNEYVNLAMRTNDGRASERLGTRMNNSDDIYISEAIAAALGLSGEAGELNDMLKKHIFHGHELDTLHVKKELGDILWYVALMCSAFGFSLDDVMQTNIDKLKARYPEGFSEYRSQHRHEGDV